MMEILNEDKMSLSINYLMIHKEDQQNPSSTFKNVEPHNQSSDGRCIPGNLEKSHYFMTDSAFEAKENGTSEKNRPEVDQNQTMKSIVNYNNRTNRKALTQFLGIAFCDDISPKKV